MRHHAISFFAIIFAMLFARSIQAEEQSREFLQKLRDQGYYDLVEAYLQRAADDPGIDSDVKDSLSYERAVNVVQRAVNEADKTRREKQLAEASDLFTKFVSQKKTGELVDNAEDWLRKISLEQARTFVSKSKESGAKNPETLLNEARVRYDQAAKSYKKHADNIKAKLKSKDSKQPISDLRNEYLQSRLALANIKYEKAVTLKSADKKVYDKALKEAAAEFHDLSEKYPKYAVGLLAIVSEGRCLQDLGETPKALGLYDEFLDPRDSPIAISALAAKLAVECHAEEDLEKALAVGDKWLADADDRNNPAVQDMQLALATTLKDKAGSGKNRGKWLAAARKRVMPLARANGPRQFEARKLLAQLPGGESAKTTKEDIKSYADAKLAAEETRDEIGSAQTTIRVLQSAGGRNREGVKKDIAEANTRIEELQAKGIEFYTTAIELAPPTTPPKELNELRYYLCFYHFQQKQYFDAAVLGEHLARKHVGDTVAKPAAKLAMASYQMLYGNGKDQVVSEPAMRRLISVADYVAATWPNESESQDALMTLVSFMVYNGDVAKAQTYLNKIPDDSPRRGEAEMKTGRALWSSYTTQLKQSGGQSNAQLDEMKKRAETLLARGIERMKSRGKSPELALAALSLTQIYIDTNQAEKAVSLLNDKDIGPLTLVKKNDAAVQTPGMDAAVFKTALRAQLARLATSNDSQAAMDDARETMDLLKQSMGDSPTGRQRLTATYVGLARDLQNQLEITPPAARVGLAQGFDAFLSEVNQSATEFNVKNWIAETYYKLGEALELDGNPTPEAKQYFAKSGDAYKKMLDAAEGGEIKLNPAMAIQMRMRRAGTMRRLGAFERATDEFDQILRARNNMLNVQIEAAQTLKAHGIAGDAKLFNDAIKGARRNANTGKNTIWGWSRIARVAQSQMQRSPEQREKFGATFFDAQYQYAECRFLQAMKSSGEAKKKYLGSASNVIGYTASSFPDFGGDEGRARFDQLMKKIQKASGTEPVGLGAKK